jgi:DNA-binding transcriptional LysR family regulator
MNLSQLEVLVAISETGSFTAAADKVGLTRSAVSHALAGLEAELGVTLVERERGNTIPTGFGNCILRYARDILGNVETIQQEAAAVRGMQAGKLRIGILSSVAAATLTGILRKFRQEYPAIELVTFEGTGREVEGWILDNVVDVGFVVKQTAGIETIFIGCDEVRVIVPTNHALRRQRSVRFENLSDESFIMPKSACDFLDPLQSNLDALKLQHRYEASEVHTILAMIREGLGITILPEMLLPSQLDGLHTLSLDPPVFYRFGLGVRSQRGASPAARLFIQAADSWAKAHGFEYPMEQESELVHDLSSS